MMRGGLIMSVALLSSVLLIGCETGTRHRVLNFFFDGVPPQSPISNTVTADAGKTVEAAPIKTEAAVSNDFVHKPYADSSCAVCHDSAKLTLTDKLPGLCNQCHAKRMRKPHAEVGANCAICHEPHRSDVRYLLTSMDLCTACHEAGKGHKKFIDADKTCYECHKIHE